MLAYRFRLYPSREQEKNLLRTLEACRFVYNQMLKWVGEQKKSDLFELKRRLPNLKEKHPWLKEVYSQALQNEVLKLFNNLRVLSALKRKGKRVGKLRFKGRGWFKSFVYPQFGFRIENNRLILSKIGKVPIKIHRKIRGRIKRLTVKHESSGKWYAIFQVDDGQDESRLLPKTGKIIGIDVGIRHFLTDSQGRQIENPRFYEHLLKRIRIRHKQLSRKKKGSKNREKARIRLARVYEKLVNQRNDFLHKLSRFYVNSYDVIAIEDLNIAGMTKNRNLARHILDASWGKFFTYLSYKAERAGKVVVRVNPRGTSQEYKNGKLDRDYNAALNILERGLIGPGRSEVTPVETRSLRELMAVPASLVIEAGSLCPLTGKQFTGG